MEGRYKDYLTAGGKKKRAGAFPIVDTVSEPRMGGMKVDGFFFRCLNRDLHDYGIIMMNAMKPHSIMVIFSSHESWFRLGKGHPHFFPPYLRNRFLNIRFLQSRLLCLFPGFAYQCIKLFNRRRSYRFENNYTLFTHNHELRTGF